MKKILLAALVLVAPSMAHSAGCAVMSSRTNQALWGAPIACSDIKLPAGTYGLEASTDAAKIGTSISPAEISTEDGRTATRKIYRTVTIEETKPL